MVQGVRGEGGRKCMSVLICVSAVHVRVHVRVHACVHVHAHLVISSNLQ